MGNNRVALCHAEMNRAIQHYFDTVVFREGESPEVTQVIVSGNVFDIHLRERNPEMAKAGKS